MKEYGNRLYFVILQQSKYHTWITSSIVHPSVCYALLLMVPHIFFEYLASFYVRFSSKSSCLPTNLAINCLLYPKLKKQAGIEVWHTTMSSYSWWARCSAPKLYHDVTYIKRGSAGLWDMIIRHEDLGRHEDLSHTHVTSLDQSYFFIHYINYLRYNNAVCLPRYFLERSHSARVTLSKAYELCPEEVSFLSHGKIVWLYYQVVKRSCNFPRCIPSFLCRGVIFARKKFLQLISWKTQNLPKAKISTFTLWIKTSVIKFKHKNVLF